MSKNKKAYEIVIDHVKAEILNGNLVVGQKLPPEREMAEKMNVGRNTIREAMRSLSLLGFISSSQGAGNYVTCNFQDNFQESIHWMLLMDEIDYRQISELREGLETYAALLAVDRITPPQLKKIENIVNMLRESSDEKAKSKWDKDLHYTIALASKNQLIIHILKGLSNALDEFIPTMREKIQRKTMNSRRLQDAHDKMYKGLLESDKEIISEAYKEHFDLINQSLRI